MSAHLECGDDAHTSSISVTMVSLTAIEDTMTALNTTIAFGLLLPFASVAHAEGEVFPPPTTLLSSDFDTSTLPKESISRPTMSNGLPHHVEARLIADHQSIAPGAELQLGIWLEQDDEWHTYWKSPGTIGKPTLIDWRLEVGEGDAVEELDVSVSDHEYPIPTSSINLVSYPMDMKIRSCSYQRLHLPESLDSDTLFVKRRR